MRVADVCHSKLQGAPAWMAMVSLTISSGLYRKAIKNAMPLASEAMAVPISAKANER